MFDLTTFEHAYYIGNYMSGILYGEWMSLDSGLIYLHRF